MIKFGIIAEGKADCAVLRNILIGLGLIEKPSQIAFLRPRLERDASDRKGMDSDEFGSWTLVKKDCQERNKFHEFFIDNELDEDRWMIVQLDSAECDRDDFGVTRPAKEDANYCESLRNVVTQKVVHWLGNQYIEKTKFAICVEEMEAWLLALALREKKFNSSIERDPKKFFEKYLNDRRKKDKTFDKEIRKCYSQGAIQLYDFLSSDFQKLKKKKIKICLKNNLSLKLFVESLPAV